MARLQRGREETEKKKMMLSRGELYVPPTDDKPLKFGKSEAFKPTFNEYH